MLKSHSETYSLVLVCIFPTALPNCTSTATPFTALHYLRAVRTQREAPFSHSPSIYSTINLPSLFTTCTLTLSSNLPFKLDGATAFFLLVSSCKQKHCCSDLNGISNFFLVIMNRKRQLSDYPKKLITRRGCCCNESSVAIDLFLFEDSEEFT